MKKLLLLAPVLLFAIAECTARFYYGLGDPPLSDADADMDYIFRPNQRCRRFGNAVNYNNLSMRMDEDVDLSDARERVFVVGDSVVNGGSLTDQADLATTLLQKAMPGRLVCNVSAGSWGPGNYAAYFRRHPGLVRSGDVLVVEASTHDLWEDDPREGAGSIVGTLSFPSKRPWCALWEGYERYFRPRFLSSGRSRNRKVDAQPSQDEKDRLAAFNLAQLDYVYSLPARRKVLILHRTRAEAKVAAAGGRLSGAAGEGESALVSHARERGVDVAFANLNPDEDYRDTIHPNESGQYRLFEAIRRAVGQ